MIVCIIISVILLLVSMYLSSKLKQRYLENLVITPYECGFDPYNTVYNNAIAKFYLIAVLYLLFDLELSILLPVSIIFQYSSYHYISICGLIFILFLGFIVEKYYDLISVSHFSG